MSHATRGEGPGVGVGVARIVVASLDRHVILSGVLEHLEGEVLRHALHEEHQRVCRFHAATFSGPFLALQRVRRGHMLVEHVGDGDMEVVDALLSRSSLQLVDVCADDFAKLQ